MVRIQIINQRVVYELVLLINLFSPVSTSRIIATKRTWNILIADYLNARVDVASTEEVIPPRNPHHHSLSASLPPETRNRILSVYRYVTCPGLVWRRRDAEWSVSFNPLTTRTPGPPDTPASGRPALLLL